MPRADELGVGLALHVDELLFERDADVLGLYSVPAANKAVPSTNDAGDVRDLKPAGLPLVDGAAKLLEHRNEEALHERGLEPLGLRTLHVLPQPGECGRVEDIANKGTFFSKLP